MGQSVSSHVNAEQRGKGFSIAILNADFVIFNGKTSDLVSWSTRKSIFRTHGLCLISNI